MFSKVINVEKNDLIEYAKRMFDRDIKRIYFDKEYMYVDLKYGETIIIDSDGWIIGGVKE